MKIFPLIVSTWLVLSIGLPVHAWEKLSDGLSYRVESVHEQEASIHLLRIDLDQHRLDLLLASERGSPRAQIATLVEGKQAVAAINASFFDVDGRAMGLVIKNYRKINPLRRAAWGIFQLLKGAPSIIHTHQYHVSRHRELAIQAGPRLIIDKRIPRFKNDVPARRSGVCVTPKGHVILAVASPMPITLKEFAESLKPSCQVALNFDGGSSTQFYLNTEKKKLLLPGREPVPNVLAVFRR